MDSNKDQRVAKPKKIPVTRDKTQVQPKPLPPPQSIYTQVYHNFGSASTSGVNSTGSDFYPSWWESQIWNRPIQYGPMFGELFSNYPMLAGLLQVGQGSLLASADQMQRTCTEENKNSRNKSLQESEETEEERKRQEKRKSSKRSRVEIERDRDELIDSVDRLDAENAALKKKLLDLSDECVKLTDENNSLLGELVKEYGLETIVNLLNAQPSDKVAGGGNA